MADLSIRVLSWTNRRTRRLRKPTRTAAILPPASPGSLGDEAMVRGMLDRLARDGFTDFLVLGHDTAGRWAFPGAGGRGRQVCVGEYLRWGSPRCLFRALWGCRSAERFYLFGADMLDGHYSADYSRNMLRLATRAARAGIDTRVVGASWNTAPAGCCVAALRELVQAGGRVRARDSASRARMERDLGAGVEQTMDAAFLLRPAGGSPRVAAVREWTDAQRREGRVVLGVNLSCLLRGRGALPAEVPAFATRFVEALALADRRAGPLSCVFVHHDLRGAVSDRTVAEAAFAALPPELRDRAQLASADADAAEVKAIAGCTDAVFSGRMHLTIAALGMGVPVAAVTYQDKFEGLFEFFGLGDQLLSPADCGTPEAIADRVVRLVAGRAAAAGKVAAARDRAVELAERNL